LDVMGAQHVEEFVNWAVGVADGKKHRRNRRELSGNIACFLRC
jgi:hypothetical protein